MRAPKVRTMPLSAAVTLVGLSACALSEASLRDRDTDGPTFSFDAGASRADGGLVPMGPSEADFDDGSGVRGRACLDFVDNNMDGVFDCDEPACERADANLACCVGSTAVECCDARELHAVAALACDSLTCLAYDGTTLTSALGRVVTDAVVDVGCAEASGPAFAPFGSTASHAYMVVPEVIDTRSAHVRIEGRLGAGASSSSSDVAAAGFGLFTEQGIGPVARPIVAVVASASEGDVRVIVGDRVIDALPLGSGGCTRSLEYALDLSPTGEFSVHSRVPGGAWDETPLARGNYDLATDARVAMFGQQPNPDGAPVVWVSGLRVSQDGCDLLAPARRAAPIVPATAEHDVDGLTVFARDAERTSFEALLTSGDQIYWLALQSGSGGLVSSMPGAPFGDNIQPTWPGYVRFRDVEVLERSAGGHRVLLAASRDGTVFEIVSTTYTPDASPSRPGALGATLTPIVSASAFPVSASGATAVSVDGPTAAELAGIGVVVAARVVYSDGHSEIRIVSDVLDSAAGFEAAAPDVSARDAEGVTTDGLVHASQGADEDAFDRDEVADPQIVVIDGVARVLYAGRRGTRWSVGSIVASPAFTHFIPVSRAPILAPAGTGFDALGVTEPALLRRAGSDWLYFAGSDGARRGVGVAVQPVIGAAP